MRSHRITSPPSHHQPFRGWPAVVMLVVSSVAMSSSPASAAALPYRVDLKVLVLDDGSSTVGAIKSQMEAEGVPYTAANIATANITNAFLASGNEAKFQAVVVPDYALSALSPTERTALRNYEVKFGIRQVDANDYPNIAVGMNTPVFSGNLDGMTANVTTDGKAAGFGYLNGPVPFSIGSWTYVAQPLAASALPTGAMFTPFVESQPPGGGVTGSLIGAYSNAGVEQLVITAAFSFTQPHFKYLGHGIITWMTRGVHFGYDRNNLTFHVDDAFSEVAIWNSEFNCTPGEDCPRHPDGTSTVPETSVRMSPADVAYAAAWEQANGYKFTFAFNGFYAYVGGAADPLADALRANQASFSWLNHGLEHIFQGCVQNFTGVPWACTTDVNGTVWVPQQTIYNEIHDNIVSGNALGLTFDTTEYLSGEHSGLIQLPQQSIDNPNFIAALTQAGILHIGSDASREAGARQVGTATTIPRHPTALYYNTSTQAEAVDEYNWLYTSLAAGGSGLCGAATPPCIAPLDPATGFTSYIVPTDAAYDLNFILSNDPRPFYAHTTNMTGDRLLYNLLDSILGTYRAAFTPATPPINLTLTQASTELNRQTQWATTGSAAVTGYLQNGQVTITNTAGVAVPFTAPVGTTINGTTLQPYGGELSAWLAPGSTTGTLPPTVLAVTGGVFVPGLTGTMSITGSGIPTPTVTLAGTLPTGLSFTPAAGAVTITGTPAAGTQGSYPLSVTVISASGHRTDTVVLTVSIPPLFTSAPSATAVAGTPFLFIITTTGSPAPTVAATGTLPSGITFSPGANGAATLTGTASDPGTDMTFPVTFMAHNIGGDTPQAFALRVHSVPTGASSPPVAPTPAADHVSLKPARLADTRPNATTVDGLFAGGGIRGGGSTLELVVAGRGDVAADAVAVALNVTVAEGVGGGYVTVYPCGEPQPTASNLNFAANAVVANAVVAKVGVTGAVCLFVSNDTHLIVDVNAYFPATSSLHSINPARVLETRAGLTTIDGLQQGGGARSRGTVTEVQITGRAAVPEDATAVVLNVTVTEAQGPGFVTVYPCGTAAIPTASNLNYRSGSTMANLVIAKIGADGKVCIFTSEGAHLVADINGYFPATTSYRALDPARLLDTRSGASTIDGQFLGAGIRPAGTITELAVADRGGVPAGAVTIVLSVTVTESQVPGFVTVYPCGIAPPLASNVNYGTNTTVANAVIVKLGTDGKVCLFNSGPTQLVADVNGYMVN
jgi:hypothetical protein